MSTPTPRTDRAWNVNGDDNAEAAWSLAQKLERELAAERAYVSALEDQLDSHGIKMAQQQAARPPR